jgi:hypothetical protein
MREGVTSVRSFSCRASRGIVLAIAATLGVALAVSAGLLIATSTASANAPPPVSIPSWWNGICDKGYNSTFYKAAEWDGLIACGPGGSNRQENQSGSPLSENEEWECVELSERWLYQAYNLPQRHGNGNETVGAYWSYIQAHPSANYPLQLVTPSSATSGSLGPGDVVSYGNAAPGHTDVVISTSPTPFTGTGEIETLNQNAPPSSK